MASSDFDPRAGHRDASKEAPDGASTSRHRFRTDLQIVPCSDPDMAGSDVTVINVRSGEKHVLTADEWCLCRAADGTNTLAAIRLAFKAETGREISHGKLFAFFRRLRSLGLLEAADADSASSPAAVAAVAENSPQATEARSSESANWPMEQDESLIIDAAGVVRGTVTAAGEKTAADIPTAASAGLRRKRAGASRTEAGGEVRSRGPANPGGLENPAGPAGRREGQGGSAEPRDAGDFAGAFSGGMGAGGFRPLFAGGLEGRAPSSGAVQNFLAGMVARARTLQEAPEAKAETPAKAPVRVSLFNPNAVLALLAALTWPLKYVFVPLLLAVPATIWIAYEQREILVQDIRAFDVSVVGTIILGLVIANLTCRVAQGIFTRGFGAEVKQFGIMLTFGIPRFFVDLDGIATLSRRSQLWVHAAPLIARLGLFCTGTLVWFAVHQSVPSLSHLALIVGQIGLLAFLLSALPLLRSDGYRWLATYLGRSALRSDALASLRGRPSEAVTENDVAEARSPAERFYLLATAIAVSVIGLVVQAYFDILTTGAARLLTGALLLGLCIAIAVWVIALWHYGRSHPIKALDGDASRQVLSSWMNQSDIATKRPVSIAAVGKIFWAMLACALLGVVFLPYRYDPGGKFEFLPAERTVVAARTSGTLEQVLVHEGDWVKANQALAKLSSDDQQREINVTRAELDRAKAQLAQFSGKTTTRESDPAMDALNRSIGEAFADDTDSASAKGDAAAANYTKTEAERAARAEVERLTRKLAYARDQLADTTIRAPKDGRVITPNLHLLAGIWLRKGAELLSLADTHTLEAQIDVPEADIALVKVGNKVRLRPWSNDDREIVGTVTEIAPAAQARPYGTVVRVHASIPNEKASLRPAMTGYAKIEGDEMRVWEAFLGRIIRIVRVEMWSWIP